MTPPKESEEPGPSGPKAQDVPVADIQQETLEQSKTNSDEMDEIKSALYNHCTSCPPNTVFSQADLMATNIIPHNSLQTLHIVTQSLMRAGQLRIMQRPGGIVCWRCVAPAQASAHAALDPDARLVYEHIESAGREGLWSSALNKRTNFHKVVMDKCIKVLEQKRLIKSVPNRRHPGRKTYMLMGLQPAEDLTGGPFFGKGELDEEFVTQMCWWIERWVLARSWWFPSTTEKDSTKKRHRESLANKSRESLESLRAEALSTLQPTLIEAPQQTIRQRSKHMRPYPAGYTAYPTIIDITNALNEISISKMVMKISDTQLLVDTLVWDGRLERLTHGGGGKDVYRAVRSPFVERELDMSKAKDGPGLSNGLTEAPCGRCPVAEVCEDDGIISARTCVYLQEWMEY